MNLEWLHDFLAVERLGSLTSAATERNVTQPAFSRRIRALEDWVGTPLFARRTRGIALTPAGERFRLECAAVAQAVAVLRRESRRAADGATGPLRLAATHALSFTFVPGWLWSLEQGGFLGPIHLLSDSMAACEELMMTGDADFLLGHAHPAAKGQLDGSHPNTLIVGRDLIRPYCAVRDGQPLWWLDDAQAGEIPLLTYAPESGLGRILAAALPDIGDAGYVFSGRLAATLRSLAQEGRGVAWLPDSLVGEAVGNGILAVAGSDRWTVPLEVRLAASPTATASGAGRALWAAACAAAVHVGLDTATGASI